MKKIIPFSFLIFLFSISGYSQSALIVMSPPTNGWGLQEVEFIQIENSAQKQLNCTFALEITDYSGNSIYSNKLIGLKVNKGIYSLAQLQGQQVQTFGLNEASQYLENTGFLPGGKYVFKAQLNDAVTGAVLYSTGFEVFIQAIQSPIKLAFPFDKDTIPTLEPVFSWIPPAPIDPDKVEYRLQLYDLGQGKASSMSGAGTPIFEASSLKDLTLPYSSANNGQRLEWGDNYQWKVTAYTDKMVVSESQVWTFVPFLRHNTFRPDSTKSPKIKQDTTIIYWIMDNTLNAGYYKLHDGNCYITFSNYSSDTALDYQVFDIKHPQNPLNGMPTVHISSGKNYTRIPLKQTGLLINNKQYLLVVHLNKQQAYKVRFTYKES